ncbi:MAG: hypothetical protein ACOYL6_17215 [Bacteriovoracaceae bacterium]
MKKMTTFGILSTLLLSLNCWAECPIINIPSYFEADEKVFSVGTDMDLTSKNQTIGTIEERVMNSTRTFELMDSKGKMIARAKKRFISWGTQIDVTDCNGKSIATIKELVWSSFFSTETKYEVLNPQGLVIASSDKKEFFSSDFTIKDNKGQIAFKMHRPTFNWVSDTWEITMVKPGIVDYRIITMIPAFKTSADNDKRDKDD